MRCLQVSKQEKEDVYPSRLQRESLDSEGVKLFEKNEETIPSPLQQFRGRQPFFQLI
jgi:hypothetical protein